jgi:hypothetical protein
MKTELTNNEVSAIIKHLSHLNHKLEHELEDFDGSQEELCKELENLHELKTLINTLVYK